MEDLNSVQMWRQDDAAVAGLITRATRFGSQHRPDAAYDADQLLPIFTEAVEHFQEVMRHAHRAAILAVAADVEYVAVTAHLVAAAGNGRSHDTAADYLEERRGRALDKAESIVTAADAHAANLQSIQKVGASVLARMDVALRNEHTFQSYLIYILPVIAIPEELSEIGQTRVQTALDILTNHATTDTGKDIAS
jgi:hypothetical protein